MRRAQHAKCLLVVLSQQPPPVAMQLLELLREVRADDATGAVQSTVEELTAILMGLPRREVSSAALTFFLSPRLRCLHDPHTEFASNSECCAAASHQCCGPVQVSPTKIKGFAAAVGFDNAAAVSFRLSNLNTPTSMRH